MLLAIDIGNSNIKCGVFEGDELTGFSAYTNFSELVSFLKKNRFDNYAICSVVPHKLRKVKKVMKKFLGIEPFVITKDVKFNLSIDYKTPETLGMDRLCSAEAALHLQKEKGIEEKQIVLSIDFGTATTINIVKYPGIFTGGLIAPGVKTMFKSLHTKTAQLPRVSLDNYKTVIGDDTISSIASGVVNSTVGLIERTINHLYESEECEKVFVYLTGGFAERIKPFLNGEIYHENYLVLKGVNLIYSLNHK